MTSEGKSRVERIDAHQHFWRFDPAVHGFIDESMPVLRRDYLPAHLAPELSERGLDGCIAVQAPETLAETRFLLELADAHDFVRGVVGWVDLRAPNLDEVLAELGEHPSLVGIRHIVQSAPDAIFEDAAFWRGVGQLAEHDLGYDVLVYERQLPLVYPRLAELPDMTLVLDHAGKPNLREPNIAAFLRQLAPLARLPNVVCKLSGLVTEAKWSSWSAEELRPVLDGALGLFGTERLLFGSDWPVCLLAASYGEVFDIIDDYFRGFSDSERAAVFGGNALRAYRIPGRTHSITGSQS